MAIQYAGYQRAQQALLTEADHLRYKQEADAFDWFIPHSKTDQLSVGRTIYSFLDRSMGDVPVTVILRHYLSLSGI